MIPPSLQNLLDQPRRADQPVARHEGEWIGWDRFRAEVAGFAAAAGDLPRGAAVALFDERAYPFASALLGLWVAGCVPVLASNATPGTQRQLAQRVSAFWGTFDRGRPLVPAAAPASLTGAIPTETRLELFTSGSSGMPKAVGKYLSQFDTELRALERCFGAVVGSRPVLSTVSHQHIYGLLFKVLWPMVTGRWFDSHIWRDSAALARQAQAAGGVVWVASPAHLKRLPPDYPWASARAGLVEVFSSGGPLPPSAAQQWQRNWGQAPLEVFGSTETGGIGWRRQRLGAESAGVESAGAEWTPLPGVEVRAAAGGALEVRSGHLEAPHWRELDDGGEVVEADGRFVLTGRRDRVVKVEEKRLSLPELEARLTDHPLLVEAAALLLDGRRPQVAVVAVPNAEGWALLDAEGRASLGQRLRRDLGRYFEPVLLPRRWRFMTALPVNAQGKLSQSELAGLFHGSEPFFPQSLPQSLSPARLLPEVLKSRVTGARAELHLRIPADLAYLQGHFPVQPILPGVVQIHWAVGFARELLPPPGHPEALGRFGGMEALKFRQLILPEQELELELEYEAERERLRFRYRSASGELSTGRINLMGAQ